MNNTYPVFKYKQKKAALMITLIYSTFVPFIANMAEAVMEQLLINLKHVMH